MKLTDVACRKAKAREREYLMGDGDNLGLLVKPNGTKLWRMRITTGGKRRLLSFGAYPEVSLAAARSEAKAARSAASGGLDPASVTRSASGKVVNRDHLFRVCADKWHQHMVENDMWTPKTADLIWRRLSANLFPAIGHMAMDEIATRDMKEAIQAIEARGSVTLAKRVRQAADQIFDFAEVDLDITLANPATKKLNRVLRKAPPVKHHKALPESMVPDLYRGLRNYKGRRQTALSLELLLHVPIRTSELRWGRWSEISGDTWLIPAKRDDAPCLHPKEPPLGMKMRRPFTAPLTPQALDILAKLEKIADGSEWIFPSVGGNNVRRKPGRPAATLTGVVQKNWMRNALVKLGLGEYSTPHGFRGTFSTAMNERKAGLGFDKDWIEFQLAHAEGDKVREAYNSAEYLEGRRKMMTWWSDWLDEQKALSEAIDPELAAMLG